jgi:hypothetical protein
MLGFDCDKDLTMDESAFIQVYSGQEFIFSMPCNKKELLDLKQAVKKGLQKIEDHKDIEQIQKTQAFWNEIKKNNGAVDTQKLLKEYREKKRKK